MVEMSMDDCDPVFIFLSSLCSWGCSEVSYDGKPFILEVDSTSRHICRVTLRVIPQPVTPRSRVSRDISSINKQNTSKNSKRRDPC